MEYYLILAGLVFLLIGCSIGYFIAAKTKLVDRVSKETKERDKIINDPELIKTKMEESMKKLNPEAEGKPLFVDEGTILDYQVEEKDGKKSLVLKKTEYMPPKEEKKKIPQPKQTESLRGRNTSVRHSRANKDSLVENRGGRPLPLPTPPKHITKNDNILQSKK